MNLYIDTEFNGFQGELISMALVAENGGQEWYEVLSCSHPVPWVAENVIPILGKQAVFKESAQRSLEAFLNQWQEITVIADWPEDIAHFCKFLITGPGTKMSTPRMKFEIIPISGPSVVPHNALHDARGIRNVASVLP